MNCPICQHDRSWPVAFARDPAIAEWRAASGDNAPYEWRLCSRCGNAHPTQQPRLEILQRVWAANRTDADAIADGDKIWRHRQTISRAGAERSYRYFAALARVAGGRFIDVACGLGATVKIFAEHGWDAEGIDADPSTARFHQQLGIRASIGQFETADIGVAYDMIHIAHAIYFITDPMGFLRQVRQRLAPDGLFCVVLADFLANADAGLPAYAHTFFPTLSSMRYALALAGFDTIFAKKSSGSIFIAARPTQNPALPAVSPPAILWLHRSKKLRYEILGRPYLALRRFAKRLLGRA